MVKCFTIHIFLLYTNLTSQLEEGHFCSPSYESLCRLIDPETLIPRRNNCMSLFRYELLMGRIDSENILGMINFNFPPRCLRVLYPLYLPRHRTNYRLFGIVPK